MTPFRGIREGAGDVTRFGSSSRCSCCLCPIAVRAGRKRRWGKGPDQRAEKWTVVWSWFCTYSWSRSRQYQMSEGSLSPQASSPILHNKEIWPFQIRGGRTSQVSVAYLSEALHPSLNISIPRMMQVPWLEKRGTLPEYLSPTVLYLSHPQRAITKPHSVLPS